MASWLRLLTIALILLAFAPAARSAPAPVLLPEPVVGRTDDTSVADRAGAALAQLLNSALAEPVQLFGVPLGIDSSLVLRDGKRLLGELDLTVPLGAVSEDAFSTSSDRCSLTFLQPGVVAWENHRQRVRYDVAFGAVTRFRPVCEAPTVVGLGLFVDVGLSTGATRLGVGADLQYRGWYSAFNYYRPLDDWHDTGAGLVERVLEGYSARLELPLFDSVKIGLDRTDWFTDREYVGTASDEFGVSLLIDLSPSLRLEFGHRAAADGDDGLQAVLRLAWPGAFGPRAEGGDLFRRFEREKRMFTEIARRTRARIDIGDGELDERGGTMQLAVELEQPAPGPVTVRLGTRIVAIESTPTMTRNALAASRVSGVARETRAAIDTASVDDNFRLEPAQIVIPAGATRGSTTLLGIDNNAAEGHRTIEVFVLEVAGPIVGSLEARGRIRVVDDESDVRPLPRLSLDVAPSRIEEDGGRATLVARLDAPHTEEVAVRLAFRGTAGAGDYVVDNTVLRFAAGATEVTRLITAVADTVHEGDDTVVVDVVGVSGAEYGGDSVVVTIGDEDPQPEMSLTAQPGAFAEAGGSATLTATLDRPSTVEVRARVALAGGAVGGGQDYDSSASEFVFAPGATEASLTLTGRDDALVEGAETVVAELADVRGARIDATPLVITVTDDDAPDNAPAAITLQVDRTSAVENGGRVRVTAVSSAARTATTVVELGFTGTAAQADFVADTTRIEIPAGQHAGHTAVTFVDDDVHEGDESLAIAITRVDGAEDAGSVQVVTIVDDDAVPELTLTALVSTLAEGGASTSLRAVLSRASSDDVVVTLAYAGSAARSVDYAAPSSLTIPAGTLIATGAVATIDDPQVEGHETIDVSVASVTGAIDASALVRIGLVDDDAAPTLSLAVSPGVVAESGGVAAITAALSREHSADVAVTLVYRGMAIAGTDYTAGTGLVIPAGQRSASLTLSAIADTVHEGDESLEVAVMQVDGALDASSAQAVTLADDDAQPSVVLAASPTTTDESGAMIAVTATLSHASSHEVAVTLGYSGDATAGVDYAAPATLTIPAGSLVASGFLVPNDDVVLEGDETIDVAIASVVAGSAAGGTVRLTLVDDDSAPALTLAVAPTVVAENGGGATITATLSREAPTDVTVSLVFGGTASGLDYAASGTTLVIGAGQRSATRTVTAADDSVHEGDETITVDVASVSGANDASAVQTITIADDDAVPSIALTASAATVAEGAGSVSVTATLSVASATAVVVDLAFAGTATRGVDYASDGTRITIAAGQTSGSRTMTAVDDSTHEGDEAIVVSVASVAGANDASTPRTVTLVDDDMQPVATLTAMPAAIAETAGSATLRVVLSGPSDENVVVTLGYSGSASGDDYAGPDSVTIPAGATEATAIVSAIDDAVFEGEETIDVAITAASGATNGATMQRIALGDDEVLPSVTTTATAASASENGGVVTVTATLSGTSSSDVVVDLGFSGSAAVGTDYTVDSARITIAAGQTSGSRTITASNDNVFEADETIVSMIAAVSGATDASSALNITLVDDETAPTVTITAMPTVVAEGGGSVDVQVALSGSSAAVVTVGLGYTGSASNGGDYSAPTSVTVPAGATTANATITIVDDTVFEAGETIDVSVASVTGAADGSTLQRIDLLDNDSAPSLGLAVAPASVGEVGGAATITATLSSASATDVVVNLGYAGTAAQGADYVASGSTLTISAGQLSTTGSVTITDDLVFEGDETVVVSVTSISGANDASSPRTLVVADNETTPTVTVAASQTSIAETGGSTSITVTASVASTSDILVNLLYGGTAGGFVDYRVVGVGVTIPAGSTSASITLSAEGDFTFEGDEQVTIAVSSASGATPSGAPVTLTIVDDDPQPHVMLSRSPASIAEGGGATTVTATSTTVSAADITVALSFAGSASAGTDYSVAAASITIPAGFTTADTTIAAIDDAIFEGDETIVVSAASVGGAVDGSSAQSITLADDETQPQLTLSRSAATVAESGGAVQVTASLSGASASDVVVDLAFGGSASGAGADYSAGAARLTIAAGSTSASTTITGVDDAVFEGDETVVVSVATVSGATDASTAQTVTLSDDETTPQVTLSRSSAAIVENGGAANITATVSGVSASDIVVTLGLTGTASAGGVDYGASTTSLTIVAGTSSASAVLTSVDDAIAEGDETIVATLTGVTGATDASTPQTVTITDDDTATLTLSAAPASIAEAGGSATVRAILDHVASSDVTVTLGFAGSATGGGTDYTASAGSIVITAGTTEGTAMLTAVGDALYEGNAAETIVVTVASTSGASVIDGSAAQTVSIVEDDVAPTLGVAVVPGSLFENDLPPTSIVTFSLSASSAVDASFVLTRNDAASRATLGSDYTISATNVTIPAGSTSAAITVTAVNDSSYESGVEELLEYRVESVSNATLPGGALSFAAAIFDDETSDPSACKNGSLQYREFFDHTVEACFCTTSYSGTFCDVSGASPRDITLSSSATRVAEGTSVTVTVTLSEANPAAPTTVTLGFGGSATMGSDYTVSATTLVFNTLQTTKSVTITTLGDSDAEAMLESIVVSVTSDSVSGGGGSHDLFYDYNAAENETIEIESPP